jgi:dTDP-4-dehydrorhamnose reductase
MDKEIKKEDKKEVKKTLIIGGDGFIGRRLAEQLKVKGKSFLATSRRKKNSKKNYFDLLKTKRVPNWDNYDVVFICAGMTSYDKCEAQKTLSRKINVIGIKRLILSLKKTKAFVIYYSSSCVYNGNRKYHKETDKLVPRSEYSRQKVTIEKYIKENLKEYAIIRVGKVVNEAFPILSKWHEEIYEKRPITAYNDFTLSPILCDELIKISLQIADEKINGVFNVSARTQVSYYTVAKAFCQKMNYKNVVIQKLKASDNIALKSIAKRHSVLNTTLLRKKTGVKLMNANEVIKTILHLYKTKYYRGL